MASDTDLVACPSAWASRSRAYSVRFFAFGAENRGLLFTLGLKNFRTFLTFRHHLLVHRPHQIHRRRQILDLDARDLEAPRVGGVVHHAQ